MVYSLKATLLTGVAIAALTGAAFAASTGTQSVQSGPSSEALLNAASNKGNWICRRVTTATIASWPKTRSAKKTSAK